MNFELYLGIWELGKQGLEYSKQMPGIQESLTDVASQGWSKGFHEGEAGAREADRGWIRENLYNNEDIETFS